MRIQHRDNSWYVKTIITDKVIYVRNVFIEKETERRKRKLVVIAEASGLQAFQTVSVSVLDINDNVPFFDVNECVDVIIPEDAVLETPVCRVLAVDMDEPGSDNSMITYELSGDNKDKFVIRKDGAPGYGYIYLNWSLDREFQDSYTLTVLAKDNGNPILSTPPLDIEIDVGDINDVLPVFTIPPVRVIYFAPVDPGIQVTAVTPVDGDIYPNNIIMCRLSGSDKFLVSSNGITCTLVTAQRLEFQPEPHTLNITAYNPDKPDLIIDDSSIEVRVFVTDTACFVDITPGNFIVRHKQGDVSAGVPVIDVDATSTCGDDPVFEINNQELSPNPGDPFMPSADFTIDSATGEISSISDTPAIGAHTMSVIAYHTSDPENSKDEVQVAITIVSDTNNPPEFDQPVYNVTLIAPQYTTPIELLDLAKRVTDVDDGNIGNGELIFTQVATDPDDGLFEVTVIGEVLLVRPLIEVTEAYTVKINVNVADKGVPPLSDDALVQIHIELPDTGIYPPIFGPDDCQDISVDEELPAPVYICQVQATSDLGTDITYELIDAGFFAIDTTTGRITSTDVLDYEEQKEYVLLVSASNIEGITYKPVTVNVNDINDNSPQFESNECGDVTLQEDAVLETLVCRVLAVDMDYPGTDNSRITYELTGDNKGTFEFTKLNKFNSDLEMAVFLECFLSNGHKFCKS
ncbi:cadherin EGF LAG seven-pass G-type receptor 2-like [Amphiura filiformis]|uniref:cadherin EGF LAG seven-pass G-type receptor 2-like n=1 Tax=Amphiura filiformis TaxID=82378 RepID=UPI003B20F628